MKLEETSELVVEPPPSPFFTRKSVLDWSMRIAGFGAVQSVIQLLLAIAGLIIIRALPKSEYALFAIANSMQVACTQLADLGVGIGVKSIGGRVWQDRHRFGQLINTALSLRLVFALVSVAVCLPVLAWLLRSNSASIPQTIMLCVVVLVAVVPLLGVSIWTAALLLHAQYKRVQKQDLSTASVRFGLVGILAQTRINAILAASVGVVINFIQALFLRRWARSIADPNAETRADDRKELVRLSRRSLPNTMFFCFQGQITILILTLFGSTSGIADITALGRLALLFSVFGVMFGNVLVPRFTRCQDRERLVHLYLILIGGTTLVLIPLCIAAAVFPNAFLWLLGSKYSGLGRECVWVISSGCISQIGAAMWALNSSKAWITLQSLAFIPMVLSSQIVAALLLDLHQFHNVVLFNLVTAVAPIPLYLADFWIGFRRHQAGGHA
jgi:hypothetical protein